MAAVCMAYVGIATMSRLSMPVASTKQTRKDFIAWVDAYLKGDVSQPYQYRGIDVYAARCAVLHTYGVDADLHQTDPSILRFGYHDGGRHAFDVAVDPGFIVIGTASFLNDVVHAISDFMNACQADPNLRSLVEARLPSMLQTFSVASSASRIG